MAARPARVRAAAARSPDGFKPPHHRMVEPAFAAYFWGFLFLYGGLMYALTPRAHTAAGFFRGSDAAGRPATEWKLTCSIFISWIFAKSVTNAANLGAAYGVVGGLAYACYW